MSTLTLSEHTLLGSALHLLARDEVLSAEAWERQPTNEPIARCHRERAEMARRLAERIDAASGIELIG